MTWTNFVARRTASQRARYARHFAAGLKNGVLCRRKHARKRTRIPELVTCPDCRGRLESRAEFLRPSVIPVVVAVVVLLVLVACGKRAAPVVDAPPDVRGPSACELECAQMSLDEQSDRACIARRCWHDAGVDGGP